VGAEKGQETQVLHKPVRGMDSGKTCRVTYEFLKSNQKGGRKKKFGPWTRKKLAGIKEKEGGEKKRSFKKTRSTGEGRAQGGKNGTWKGDQRWGQPGKEGGEGKT